MLLQCTPSMLSLCSSVVTPEKNHIYGAVGYTDCISAKGFGLHRMWWCPRGVMVKAMDCGIVVSEFEFQSRYYVHFRTSTLGKGMNPLILPAMG